MKKILFISIAILISSIFSITQTHSTKALAGWNAGRIIDDSVFVNTNTMNASAIQLFLNSKVPNCDTYGVQPSEYGGGTRAQWGQAKYGQSTFICLKNYSENGRSAAQIIYDTAQKYQINPQVLLVLLQKEQGLVTDSWPLNIQYRTATGYGCPDTAPCDSQYFGLANQLDWSGKMFRAILNNSPTWYTPYVLGNNYIQYSPTASCGGSTVNIQNRATQALYNYTPYQPNQAALDAGYGTVNCGAYGNRNFFLYFRDWFGNMSGSGYAWSLASFDLYANSQRTVKLNNDSTVSLTPGQTAYARLVARNADFNNWTQDYPLVGTFAPSVFKNDTWLSQDRAGRMTQSSATYDQLTTYDFSITAPQTVGTYNQKFGLVVDGVTWLNNVGPSLSVNVVSPTAAPTDTSKSVLNDGSDMTLGQKLYSPDKKSILWFENGNLILYINGKRAWSTNITNSRATVFSNQSDGNLVLYDDDGKAVWASNTAGASSGNGWLILQNDGNIVAYASGSAFWSSGTSLPDQNNRVNTILNTGYTLFTEQTLQTPDRSNYLVLQEDGNLVLYSADRGALWSSRTVGSGAYRLEMQGDGNLVLYNRQGQGVWSTRTAGRGESYFVLQSDKNLVLYNISGASWASGTR